MSEESFNVNNHRPSDRSGCRLTLSKKPKLLFRSPEGILLSTVKYPPPNTAPRLIAQQLSVDYAPAKTYKLANIDKAEAIGIFKAR